MAVEDKPIKSKYYTATKNAVDVLGYDGRSYFDGQFIGF
jgi:hypothetical protein